MKSLVFNKAGALAKGVPIFIALIRPFSSEFTGENRSVFAS